MESAPKRSGKELNSVKLIYEQVNGTADTVRQMQPYQACSCILPLLNSTQTKLPKDSKPYTPSGQNPSALRPESKSAIYLQTYPALPFSNYQVRI